MYKWIYRIVILTLLSSIPIVSNAATLKVDTQKAIRSALANAKPGDTIEIKPGVYIMEKSMRTGNDGTAKKPITLRAAGDKGYAVLVSKGLISFKIKHRFWVFKGIHFKGVPATTRATLFVDGPSGARDIIITDCKISHSGQHGMKGGRTSEKAVDNIVIEHTELFQTYATGFDIVAGKNWVMRNNYVHHFGMKKGVTYGIFLKGGGSYGIIEGCLVDGSGSEIGTTVGISFGGGKTGAQWMPKYPDGKIMPEHDNGIARNNIVIGTRDIAYHTNAGSNCKFYNNLAWECNLRHRSKKSFQRQSSYPKDPLLINNILTGALKNVLSGSRENIEPKKEWFKNPDNYDFRLTDKGKAALVGKGVVLKENPTDMFGTERDMKQSVLGPVLPDAKQSSAWIDRRK